MSNFNYLINYYLHNKHKLNLIIQQKEFNLFFLFEYILIKKNYQLIPIMNYIQKQK